MNKDLHVEIVRHDASVRFGCVLCGTYYEASVVAALVSSVNPHCGDICPGCLDLGPKVAAENARFHIVQAMNSHKEDIRESDWTFEDVRAVADVIALADRIEKLPADKWATSMETDAKMVTLDQILSEDDVTD